MVNTIKPNINKLNTHNMITPITDTLLEKIGFECVDTAPAVGKFKYGLRKFELRSTWQTMTIWQVVYINGNIRWRLDGMNSDYNRCEVDCIEKAIIAAKLFGYEQNIINRLKEGTL